jgi:hypothetical protein
VLQTVVGLWITSRCPGHCLTDEEDHAAAVLEVLRELPDGLFGRDAIANAMTHGGALGVPGDVAAIFQGEPRLGKLPADPAPLPITALPLSPILNDLRSGPFQRFIDGHLAGASCPLAPAEQAIRLGLGLYAGSRFVSVNARTSIVTATRDLGSPMPQKAGGQHRVSYCITDQTELRHHDLFAVTDGFGPLEIHLLRLLEFQKTWKGRGDDEKRLQNVIDSIAFMLFSFTPSQSAATAATKFVAEVFARFQTVFHPITGSPRVLTSHRELRVYFQSVVGPLLQGVCERQFPRKFLEPIGSRYLLRQFLMDPALRDDCRVIFAYLRLVERFDRVRFVGRIAQTAREILSEEDGPGDFLADWKEACEDVYSDLLPDDVRTRLMNTFEGRGFDLDIIRDVLLSCTNAHNEFLTVLSDFVGILEVTDCEILDRSGSPYRIRGTEFSQLLLTIVRADVTAQISKSHERQFVAALGRSTFYYIVHTSINGDVAVNKLGDRLITRFGQGKQLSAEQRRLLREKVKAKAKGPALVLLVERLMLRILNAKVDRGRQIVDYVVENPDFVMSAIECDGYDAFLTTRSQSEELFTLDHLPAIYEMLVAAADDIQTYDDDIFAMFKAKFQMTGGDDVDASVLAQLDRSECLYLRTVIVRFMACELLAGKAGGRVNIEAFRSSDFFGMLSDMQRRVFEKVKDNLGVCTQIQIGEFFKLVSRKALQ